MIIYMIVIRLVKMLIILSLNPSNILLLSFLSDAVTFKKGISPKQQRIDHQGHQECIKHFGKYHTGQIVCDPESASQKKRYYIIHKPVGYITESYEYKGKPDILCIKQITEAPTYICYQHDYESICPEHRTEEYIHEKTAEKAAYGPGLFTVEKAVYTCDEHHKIGNNISKLQICENTGLKQKKERY